MATTVVGQPFFCGCCKATLSAWFCGSCSDYTPPGRLYATPVSVSNAPNLVIKSYELIYTKLWTNCSPYWWPSYPGPRHNSFDANLSSNPAWCGFLEFRDGGGVSDPLINLQPIYLRPCVMVISDCSVNGNGSTAECPCYGGCGGPTSPMTGDCPPVGSALDVTFGLFRASPDMSGGTGVGTCYQFSGNVGGSFGMRVTE